MKRVSLLALLPWVLSCGWASSLFSSAPAVETAPAEVVAADTVALADTAAASLRSAGDNAAEAALQSAAASPGAVAASVPAPSPSQGPGPVVAMSPASEGVYSVSPADYGGAPSDGVRHSRAERRRAKVEEYARAIDSLVTSRSFLFLPSSMQEFPGGGLQMIYNVYFYLGIYGDRVEVHIPVSRGAFMPYVDILNFDTADIADYRCSPVQSGWNVSFTMTSGEKSYNVALYVCNTTGETILTLYMNACSIRYVGCIRGGLPRV